MCRRIALVAALGLISGCDVIFQTGGTQNEAPSLKAFSTEREFTDYFKREVDARSDTFMSFDRAAAETSAEDAAGAGGSANVTAAPPASPSDATVDGDALASADSSLSQTTIQEIGVDEADVIKSDETHVYMLDDSTADGTKLRIVRLSPADQLAVVGEVALEGYGRDLYLDGTKVVAVTSLYGGFYLVDLPAIGVGIAETEGGVAGDSGGSSIAGSATSDAVVDLVAVEPTDSDTTVTDGKDEQPVSDVDADAPTDDLIAPTIPPIDGYFERPKVIITIIDVSNTAQPTVVSKTRVDGSLYSSRMIDGRLYLVSANYQNYYYDVLPALGRPGFEVPEINAVEVLPRFEHTDAAGNVTEGALLTWDKVYRPNDPDGFGVVAIATFDVAESGTFDAVGVVAEPGLIYSSLDALYLTNTQYDFTGAARTDTNIYKLRYTGTRAEPTAAGSVPGRVLNQYSMSEFDGFLRVATTNDRIFTPTGAITEPTNNVYCLGEENGALAIVGRLEGLAPGETIQSARFNGTRGYLVTFEQIDPLFTLDLSDPTNPLVVGELKVPGFSTFLVPMDENHVLAVGQYVSPDNVFGQRGVQLSIFDVTDFANPVQQHNIVLGDGKDAWSEALWDPKAFNYRPEQGRLALPLTIWEPVIYPEPVPPTDVITIDTDVDANGGGTGGAEPADDAVPPVDAGIAVGEPYVPQGFEGLIVFEVSVESGFRELGRISTRFEQSSYYGWTSFTRGLFVDENVFVVTNQGVRGAPVSNVAAAAHELFYGFVPDDEPVIIDPIMDDGGIAVEVR